MDEQLKHSLEEGFLKLFNSPVIVKKQRRNKALKKKTLFISLIDQYEKALNKSVTLQSNFGIDLFEYEEPFYGVIDKIMLLVWGGSVYELITFYLYERLNLDGTMNYLVQTKEDGTEVEIFLKTPEDLYNYLMQVSPDFINEK
jgi:hypothetical protein